jgi:riboflavin kinase/FMN adenylyltransferase
VVVTIGNFDGVHLGHQALVHRARALADAVGGTVIALTFEPHPTTHFRGLEPADFRLSTTAEREAWLQQAGADDVRTLLFHADLAGLAAEAFVHDLIHRRLQATAVVVGWDFSFGHQRSGTTDILRTLCAERGIDAHILDPISTPGDALPISSSRIRHHIRRGELEDAARLLGRPLTYTGTSAPGAGRGRSVGIPTVNLYPTARLLPPRGVYGSWLHIDGVRLPAISNLGVRPTFEDAGRVSLETMALAPIDRDLHGVDVRVELLGFIRAEQAFADADALRAQIARDVDLARDQHQRAGEPAP